MKRFKHWLQGGVAAVASWLLVGMLIFEVPMAVKAQEISEIQPLDSLYPSELPEVEFLGPLIIIAAIAIGIVVIVYDQNDCKGRVIYKDVASFQGLSKLDRRPTGIRDDFKEYWASLGGESYHHAFICRDL